MNINIFNNPDNLWGKWLKLAKYQQLLILLVIISISLYLPTKNFFDSYQKWKENAQSLQQIQNQFEHKQRLLQSLKQQTEVDLLTPQLASQLLPINRSVQNLSQGLNFSLNQWIFQNNPQLKLHIQGSFPLLKNFITNLLIQQDKLKLVSLQIQKAEQENYSIESEIILQLQLVKEKQ